MRGVLRTIAAAPLVLAIAALDSPVMAQQSADQIIAALKPSGNLIAGPTRGFRLGGAPSPEAPPARAVSTNAAPIHKAAPAQVQAPAQAHATMGGPSVNLTVNFPSGSADLTPVARASLDALGKALSSAELANFRFRIEGHTDNVGAPEENRLLSQRRAEAVVNYLTSQYSVAPSRLEPVGMGQQQPVVDVPPQTPEARNRRVQVVNLGA